MFGSGGGQDWDRLLQRLSHVLDDLHAAGLSALSGEQELAVIRELETQRNRLPTVEHRLIADLQARGTAHEHACRSTAVLLTQLLRITPAEAGARVRAAAEPGPRHGLSGQVLPPIFDQVAAAQACGVISAAHARVITRAVQALPDAVRAEHDLTVQASLLTHAPTLNPAQLAVCARRIADCLDPDGTLATEHERHRRRDLRVHPRPDGSAHIEGELTPLCAEALRTVLDTLARPQPATHNHADGNAGNAGDADNTDNDNGGGGGGRRDPRTAGQRQHDGLHDALLMMLRSGLLPDCGGIAATIVLTMTPEQVQHPTGLVTTGHGALISAQLASTLLGEARLTPVALTRHGQIITHAPPAGSSPKANA